MNSTERTCPNCLGMGMLWSPIMGDMDRCRTCGGDGHIPVERPAFGSPDCRPSENEKLTRQELNNNQDNI